MSIRKSLFLFIALAATSQMAHAVSLLTNGSFETGDFTGWTASANGPGGCDTDWNVGSSGAATNCGGGGGFGLVNPDTPIDGSFAAYNSFDGDGPQTFSLSQSILVPTSVDSGALSWSESGGFLFSFIGPDPEPRIWDVSLGGTSVFSSSFNSDQDIDWIARSFDVTSILAANAGSTIDLVFSNFIPEFFTGPAGWGLDGVGLEATTALPEPGTMALFLFGLLASVRFGQRRRD
jgi:hypothetical protein